MSKIIFSFRAFGFRGSDFGMELIEGMFFFLTPAVTVSYTVVITISRNQGAYECISRICVAGLQMACGICSQPLTVDPKPYTICTPHRFNPAARFQALNAKYSPPLLILGIPNKIYYNAMRLFHRRVCGLQYSGCHSLFRR